MKNIRILSLLLALILCVPIFAGSALPIHSEEEETVESRKTPLMGWASWNAYRTDITDEIIMSQAYKLKELGLADLGYIYVNVDDGWQNGRGEDGYVRTRTDKFPEGMQKLAEDIHALGLKAGIYTDAGELTCGWISDNQKNNNNVGLYGHDESDLERYMVDWGYDFIKVDWCGGGSAGMSKQDRYTTIGNVIKQIEKQTGDDKVYNVCCWSFPGEWVVDVADSWRTGGDITNNFNSVMEQIDNIKSLAKYNGPGHVNDLDMMQIGNGMSYEEDKSHFSMWCMMSTPLMLGMDLNSISKETLAIVSNKELIALDQDPACIQATVAKTYGNVEAWTKDLGAAGSGTKAIAFLNRGTSQATVTVRFADLGLEGVSSVRDLWSHTDISVDGTYKVTVPAHGTVVLKASGTDIGTEEEHKTELPAEDDGSVVNATFNMVKKPSRVNLTLLGTYDWTHFGRDVVHMKNGAGEISLAYEGTYVVYDNAAAGYSWTNGEEKTRGNAVTTGCGVRDPGANMVVSTPCDQNKRTLTVAIGSYSADMRVTFCVGGKILEEQVVPGGNAQKQDRLVTLTYESDIPTTAYLKIAVDKDLGYSQSVNVEGVALSIEIKKNALGEIETECDKGKLTLRVPAAVCEEGASLIVEPEDDKGTPVTVAVTPVEAGAKKYAVTLDMPNDYAGKVNVFLWKDNTPLCPKSALQVNLASINDYSVGMMAAHELVAAGALLLDVRSPEEYETGHLEGAVNVNYTEIAERAESELPDKDRKIVVYCSAAKRSAQATAELLKLGYTAVYNLGSMANYNTQPSVTFSKDTCLVVTKGEKVGVSFTADRYDAPEVYISVGKDSTLENAVPLSDFTVPESSVYYMTLKAYLVYNGVCYAQTEERFIYWSEDTVSTFATDLEWTKATVGWGSIHKDKSVEGNTLKLAGKTFSHGIGTHADSEIEMAIPQGARKFLAVAGCDLEKSGEDTMMLFIYIDGKLVDHSSLIKIGQYYVFDVDIPEGAQTILLYAYEGTYGGATNDHSDWAVAGFVNSVGEV